MNILIIEDDLLLARNIKKIFEKKIITNRVKIISNYIEFIRELSVIKSYDIILVDILLGVDQEKNGLDLLSIIREKTNKIPVIIISGYDDIAHLEDAFCRGASDYIVKPFRLKELELRIFKWFSIYFYSDLSCSKNMNYFGLEYDIKKNEFYYKDKFINLTKSSKYLLSLFMSNKETLLKESYLNEKIRGDIASIIDRNIRVNILRLKNILKAYNIDSWISNVRGEGYIFKKD